MNLVGLDDCVDYIVSGYWGEKVVCEVVFYLCVKVVVSSEV